MARSWFPAGPGNRPAWWLAAVLLMGACSGTPAAGTAALPTPAPTTIAPAATAAVPSSGTTSAGAAATTSTARAEATSPEAARAVRITIVYDNYVRDPRFAGGWGFAALVEVPGHRILFDTGADGAALLANLALLGIDPSTLDALVLSHEHGDHTGGLAALLAAGAAPPVYLPASFSVSLKNSLAARVELVEIAGPREIMPGVFTTGEMGAAPVEQALVVATATGAVLITGCAHPGIVEMLQRGREAVAGEVTLVVGGFHLGEATPPAIAGIVAAFRELGVRQVAPTHCTGEAARAAFAREYGDDFLEAGAGRVIEAG